MNPARPLVVLGIDSERSAQGAIAAALNQAGLTYRFISDRKKVIGGCTQLKPDLVMLFADLGSELATAVLETLAGDVTFGKLPVVVVTREVADAPFIRGMCTGVVALMPGPIAQRHGPILTALSAELSGRPGSVSGTEATQLPQLLTHLQNAQRTGVLTVDAKTPHEASASFVRGRLERARSLGASGQEALEMMCAQRPGRWSFSEMTGKQGDGAGVVIEFGDMNTGEVEVAIVQGTPEDEPLAYELEKNPPAPTTKAPSPVAATNKVQLLLVDDDEALLRMFSTLFGKHGFEVTTAADGQQGAEAASTRDFDAVLADLNMPHLDGWGMLRVLRDDFRTRELPVAFISAHDDYRESLRALNAGAQAYLSKGTKLDAIVTQVKKLLEPRAEAKQRLATGAPVTLNIASVGPSWFLTELANLGVSGVLEAKDGWANYIIGVNAGQVVSAAAQSGKYTAEAERAFNAFIASRAAEGTFTPKATLPSKSNLKGTTRHLIYAACKTLNDNERKLKDDQLVSAKQIDVNQELYAVYREVGPKQWLEAARLICEDKLPPRELIARLDMSPVDIEETMRDLLRRGVLTLTA